MPSFIEKLSPPAREAIDVARSLAESLNLDHVSTTHLFMGLICKQNIVTFLLENIGFNTRLLYKEISKLLKQEPLHKKKDEILFTKEIKTVLEIAEKETQEYNIGFIDTVHILLGILKQENTEIYEILKSAGIKYKEVKDTYDEILKSELQMLNEMGQIANGMQQQLRDQQEKANGSTKKHLEQFGKNLVKLAKENKLDPIIGREKEIERSWQILARRKKNNIIYVGESGSGKTAIVEGLANKIASGEVPTKLKDKEILLIDIHGMIAGTKYRGEFEKKMKIVIDTAIKEKNVILFIDEIHTVIGAGSAEGTMDAANILKPYLSSGELQIIGATTTSEYQKYFEKDTALVRRFQKVNIEPTNKEITFNILKGLKKQYEIYHSVFYPDNILNLIVSLNEKYMPTLIEPDKSINTLDEIGSKLSLIDKKENKKLNEMSQRLKILNNEQDVAVSKQAYEEASKIKEQREKLEKQIKKLEKETKTSEIKEVSEKDVREVFSLISNIPVENIYDNSNESKKYINMFDTLKQKIINQDESLQTISSAIKRKKAGIDDEKKPVVLLFAGSTGTGKTYTCKKLAEFLFDNETKLVFLNGAEYSDKTAINRLTSANPGYVGYGESSDFEPIRQNPYSVLLIDECEKMCNEAWQIFLRIFEEGELKTANGKIINFKNCVIILTSNLGSVNSQKKSVGFSSSYDSETAKSNRKLMYEKEIKDFFPPEVYNRFGKIIIFNDLNENDLKNVVKLELVPLIKKLEDKKVKLIVNDDVIDFILKTNIDKTKNLGARPIKRNIETLLNDKIADIILQQGVSLKTINIILKNNELCFETNKQE